jgi:catechol 2,3-dioxygenase-like lactoylglutathione lyase family enzyme
MSKLQTLTLRVRDPEAQTQFYCDVLGMTAFENGTVGYGGGECALRFVPTSADADPQPYVGQPSDVYWKIALSVPDIELAVAQLQAQGIECSAPRQFRDVGYLAHFTDPEGLPIELIDHWFRGERPADEPIAQGFGGGAHLSLITLRCADIMEVEPQILELGLVPYSVQPVLPYGFTLYFYGSPDLKPPSEDLTAVENRPWTYQRRETVLEIQVLHAGQIIPRHHAGVSYAGLQLVKTPKAAEIVSLGITTSGHG